MKPIKSYTNMKNPKYKISQDSTDGRYIVFCRKFFFFWVPVRMQEKDEEGKRIIAKFTNLPACKTYIEKMKSTENKKRYTVIDYL